MNTLEHKMLDVLRELKEKHNAISVRAEFEAEGTKLEELLRLKELCMVADLGLTLKIGGCESIRDMLEAKLVGVDYLVAPMVESAYSLRKYLQAVEKIFSTDEGEHTEVLCNVETMTAIQNFDEMLEIPEIRLLDGIVIERVDLCFSLGLDETCINNEEVNNLVLDVITKAKKQNLTCTVGGGMSAHSLPFFSRLPDGYADRIEGIASTFNTALEILVIGQNPESMAVAVNRVMDMGGGIAAVEGEKVAFELPLPIGGMMSDRPLKELAGKEVALKEFLSSRGYPFHDPLYTFIFLPNDFLPEVRINRKGVVNIKKDEVRWPARRMPS